MTALDQLRTTLDATRIPGQCTLCGVKEYGHARWCPRGTEPPPKDQKMPPAPPMYLPWQIRRRRDAPRLRRDANA